MGGLDIFGRVPNQKTRHGTALTRTFARDAGQFITIRMVARITAKGEVRREFGVDEFTPSGCSDISSNNAE